VRLQPVARPGRLAISLLVKFLTGIGGYLLLVSDLFPYGLWPLLFAAVTIGWAIWSRDHRATSHTLAAWDSKSRARTAGSGRPNSTQSGPGAPSTTPRTASSWLWSLGLDTAR